MRGCREGMGLPVSGTLPSLAWSGARGEAQRLHRQPPMQARTISLLQAPPPLLLFICLITKQKLQSGLLYFCM